MGEVEGQQSGGKVMYGKVGVLRGKVRGKDDVAEERMM